MGLMQLLTVGRSLGRIRDEPSRYKMTQQSLLPKFGAVHAPETQVRGLSETTNPVFARADASKANAAGAATINDRKNMSAVQPELQGKVAPVGAVDRPVFPRGRWTLFRNPFLKTPKPAKPLPAPVQSELSLDAVKPVRNDLCDSDLELVQVARRNAGADVKAAEPASPAVSVASESQPAAANEVVWGRIKNQFFGAGKT